MKLRSPERAADAEQRRRVTPVEQHIHSFLEVVPLMATGFLATLHWDQARALAGRTSASTASAARSPPEPAPRSSERWPCSAPSPTRRR
ncbi:hypothetical protein [Spirillospora sp. CA-128828]|uniref:hypothetical protein n=1 Tax=Spirillospora sp. CA-128828 TaxID=3240033 RepID=UPI003D8E9493